MPESSFYIQVKPKSSRNEVVRTADGPLVRVTAPPVEGAANTAVIKTLAAALGIPKSRITITAGATGRLKRVSIAGLEPTVLEARLAQLPQSP
jgi:hypothetical protein